MRPRSALLYYFMLNVQLTTSWLSEAICVMYMYLLPSKAPPTSHIIVKHSTRSFAAPFHGVSDQYSVLSERFCGDLPNALRLNGGFPCNPHGSSATLRAALTVRSSALPPLFYFLADTNSSLFAPGTRSARGARFLEARRASECTKPHARGLEGVSIGSTGSEASYGRESERLDGGTRAHARVGDRRCGFDTEERAQHFVWGG
ncbi:hypothetical protein FB451DRAFT_1469191 [Mycena latifolia]|nr:hypothetical protein FB451DRAFT_1469191 [Mycena latifolia]